MTSVALVPLPNDYVYVYFDGNDDNFLTKFLSEAGKPNIKSNNLSFNGDNCICIFASDDSVIGIFGKGGVDIHDDYSQNGIDWHYRNSWAKHNPGQGSSATFDVNQYFPNDTAQ